MNDGMDFCTANFRNDRALKDSLGPRGCSPSQTERHYVAKFRDRIPFQGSPGPA